MRMLSEQPPGVMGQNYNMHMGLHVPFGLGMHYTPVGYLSPLCFQSLYQMNGKTV